MYFLDYGRRSIRDKGLQKENFFGKMCFSTKKFKSKKNEEKRKKKQRETNEIDDLIHFKYSSKHH